MTTLGLNMTDREPEITWGNLHTTHPQTEMAALSLSAWKLAASLADEPEPDWPLVQKLQALAKQFDQLDREEWCNEISAQEADWQDQARSERP